MWSDLTMKQRADVISMAVKAGMRDLDSIRSFYDDTVGPGKEFGDGGHLYGSGGKKKITRYKSLTGKVFSTREEAIKDNTDAKLMQDIYNQLDITDESLDSPENSAIATMARLSQMYNTEVLGRNFTGAEGVAIDPYDALLYKWMGRNSELSNHTATPELNNYINNVKRYQDDFGLYTIRANGGYLEWKDKASQYKHLNIDNDNTYDYEGWYNENPQRAWNFLKDDPNAHFDDKYKTVYHPTFSTQSKYSGVIDTRFNPQGLIGGTWSKDNHTFTMSPDGYRGPVSMDERKSYLEDAEDFGVRLREADGLLPIYDNTIWGGVLPNVTVKPRR